MVLLSLVPQQGIELQRLLQDKTSGPSHHCRVARILTPAIYLVLIFYSAVQIQRHLQRSNPRPRISGPHANQFTPKSATRNWDILSGKSLKGLDELEEPQIYQVSSSIFVISLIDEYESGILQFLNSSFTAINTLPILQIQAKQIEQQTKLINITDVIVSKCLPDRESILSPAILFQIAIQGQDKVQMEIQVSKVRIEDTQSKYGIFNIHGGEVSSIAISTSVFKRMKGYYSSILFLSLSQKTINIIIYCSTFHFRGSLYSCTAHKKVM